LNGATATAKEALKVVRRRAFPENEHAAKVDQYVDALSGNAFFNAIVDERAWEFAGEGLRKYDLVRWNLLAQKLTEFNEENGQLVTTGQLPARLGKTYSVPERLYYKFNTDDVYPEIDYSSANFYETLQEAPGEDYYFLTWYPVSETNQESYTNEWLIYLNAGYDATVNNHLFALPSEVVATSGGLWENDEYWTQLP
ncbi:MAG: RagB/SusD family nutrient uptake outer membrane protein, partial [Bacteroidales bacterium]|nr:RagB/SusD family nutrient uptake outer membrane protein [Bacteroidales bacterium]